MSRILPIMFFLCVGFPSWGLAEIVDETEIDEKVREIAKTLRCTVCQTENIWESGAPLAHQMREAVRERVIQGQSADEIRAYFHSRYGRLHHDGTAQAWGKLARVACTIYLASRRRGTINSRSEGMGITDACSPR